VIGETPREQRETRRGSTGGEERKRRCKDSNMAVDLTIAIKADGFSSR